MTSLAVAITTFVLAILSSVYKAYIILLGYGWFVLPLYPDSPELNLAKTFCLLTFFSFITANADKLTRDDSEKADGEVVFRRIIFYSICHLMMFIYYKWVWS